MFRKGQVLSVFFFVCLSTGSTTTDSVGKPPHIVFIVADDLGWNDVGFRGTRIKTPNLDSLAADGVILDQYYVQPVCTPSRAALMTGRYPFRYGLQHYVLQPGHDYGLNLNETLLPQRLKEAGYATHAVGKWHLGMYTWSHTPTFRGFDSFFGFYGGGEDYYKHTAGAGYDMRRDNTSKCGKGCSQVAWDAQGKYSTTIFAEEAVKIIEQHNASQPLFLYLPFQAVHAPDEVPQQYVKPYEGIISGKRQTFAGMLSCLDEGIGNVTKALQSKEMWSNTFLVFTTDNGGPIAGSSRCHICGDNTGCNNYPLRGGKHTLWEGGVRGTALVHGEMIEKPKSVRFGLMHMTDWFPTILSLVGLNVTKNDLFELDGVNQWDMISTNATSLRNEVVFNIDPLHNAAGPMKPGGGGDAAIRMGDWKLLVGDPGPPDIWSENPSNETFHFSGEVFLTARQKMIVEFGGQNTTVQLFNVRSDEREMKDLAKDETEQVSSLLAALKRYEAMAVPPLFQFGPADPNSNPKNFGGAWTPWKEEGE